MWEASVLQTPDLEVWGGCECTVARIRGEFRNQLEETGLYNRLQDLTAVRALGIKTFRYPLLWETVAPENIEQCNWSWHDERLSMMQDIGLSPIAGLLHHGSGPRYTSLLDANFPVLFARFAEAAARRFPWLSRFTPINEPLTTARFSALYGHWYPHAADMRSFVAAVVIQCKATVLAMRAIRDVNPQAELIQTEDVGKTFSTPALQAQADHENQRRWLSLDLLCGKVDKDHVWHGFLLECGVSEADIEFFGQEDVRPSVIGVNYYLTSERYLDGDLARYPPHLHGTDGFQTYADTEAVRIELSRQELGPAARLSDVWTRYGRPLAITEVHHGCTRDEQLRWLSEVWTAANGVRETGVDLRAVTVWSLLGAFDWNSLLTQKAGFYEPGAFDIRAPVPRLTALGKAVASLTKTAGFEHPVLGGAGWWRRDDRFYGASRTQKKVAESSAQPLLLVGTSSLSRVLQRICAVRGLAYLVVSGQADSLSLFTTIEQAKPWAIIAPGPFTTSNTQSGSQRAADLARACAAADIPLVIFSSDRIFAGSLDRAYLESDDPCPCHHAGRLAASIEQHATAVCPKTLIIRHGPLLNAWDKRNFGIRLLAALVQEQTAAFSDDVVSPAYAPDLAHASLDLLIDGERGAWHLSNRGAMRLSDLVLLFATATDAPTPRQRSLAKGRNFALASGRGWITPGVDDALARFLRDCRLADQIPTRAGRASDDAPPFPLTRRGDSVAALESL